MEKLYLSVVCKNIGMDIHVRAPIEFEKILDYTFTNSIQMTRQRISIQQLLDQQSEDSSEEDKKQLIRHLNMYSNEIKAVITNLKNKKLTSQPRFSWSINNETVETPCWLFEAIMPRVVNYKLNLDIGKNMVKNEKYVDANKYFKEALRCANECYFLNESWKWKMPHMNHKIVSSKWHIAQIHKINSLMQLTTLARGQQQGSTDKTLYVLSQRALHYSALSYMQWKDPQTEMLLKMSDAFRYMYSANILWNNGQYGSSIYRLQHWLKGQKIETDTFDNFKEELEKIPFLLQERKHVNDSAYFEPIEPTTELPNLQSVIHTKNIKHPDNPILNEDLPQEDAQ